MFTRMLVTKAEINVFMYQNTERKSYTLCHMYLLLYNTKPDSSTCQYRLSSRNYHQDLPHSLL